MHVAVLAVYSFMSFKALFNENLAIYQKEPKVLVLICMFSKLVMTDLWMNLLSCIFSMNLITELDSSGFWVQLTESMIWSQESLSLNSSLIFGHVDLLYDFKDLIYNNSTSLLLCYFCDAFTLSLSVLRFHPHSLHKKEQPTQSSKHLLNPWLKKSYRTTCTVGE